MNEVIGSSGSSADLLPFMLLLLITMTVSGIICMFSVLHYVRNRRSIDLPNVPSNGPARLAASSAAMADFIFDQPACWVAIRSRNLSLVQEVVGLQDASSCSWMEGLTEVVTDNRLFISPPIREWILVFGPSLPRPSDDIDQCFRFLTRLSKELGEVQYFSRDSVTYEHAWARLVDGTVVRAYAWFRETLWNQGHFSEAERSTGVQTFGYAEAPDPAELGAQDRYRANTERIYALAGRWSVDPSRVNQSDLMSSGLGVSGSLSSIQPL